MFALRWLNAPDKPQLFPLNPGTLVLGRGPECDIQIKDSGISKQHIQFQITSDKVLIKDLNSTNGTYVNGIKIQHQRLQAGDKVLLHELIFDIVEVRTKPKGPNVRKARYVHPDVAQQMATWQNHIPAPSPVQHSPSTDAISGSEAEAEVPSGFQLNWQSISSLGQKIQHYFDEVAMPGVYRLAEMTEFRVVLAVMVGTFVVLVTILATIPMANLTKNSMEVESRRRALTLARYVEARNREAIAQGIDSALDVNLPHEEGVKAALIVAHNDGHILAPASKAGRYEDLPFVAGARQKETEFTERIDANTIGASVPIRFFNTEQGGQVTGAHVIVLYDMGSLATDDGRVISLFVQVLFLALILGAGLFVVMYRLIEHPIRQLNTQLDEALRDGRQTLDVSIQFPVLEALASNIVSALSRIGHSEQAPQAAASFLATDVENLVQMVPTPALAVRGSDETIIAINPSFEALTGLSPATVFNQPLDSIIDQALRLNLQALIARSRQSGGLETDQLEMVSGNRVVLACKAVTVADHIGFYLVVLQPAESELAA